MYFILGHIPNWFAVERLAIIKRICSQKIIGGGKSQSKRRRGFTISTKPTWLG